MLEEDSAAGTATVHASTARVALLRHQNWQLMHQVALQQEVLRARADGVQLVENLALDLNALAADAASGAPADASAALPEVASLARRLERATTQLYTTHASPAMPWLNGGLRRFQAAMARTPATNDGRTLPTRRAAEGRSAAAACTVVPPTLAALSVDEAAAGGSGVDLVVLAAGSWEHLNLQHVARLEDELAVLRRRLAALAVSLAQPQQPGQPLHEIGPVLSALREACQHLLQLSVLLPVPGHPALREERPVPEGSAAFAVPDANALLAAMAPSLTSKSRSAAAEAGSGSSSQAKRVLTVAWEMVELERRALQEEVALLRQALADARTHVASQVRAKGRRGRKGEGDGRLSRVPR